MIYEYSDFFKTGNNKVVLGFNCYYDSNYNLHFAKNNIKFDSHNIKIRINEIVNNFDLLKSKEYEERYGNVTILAIAMYLFDNINEVEYVKFINRECFDTLYRDEVLKMLSFNNQ